MAAHTCNPSAFEPEAVDLYESEATLAYHPGLIARLCLKKQKSNKNKKPQSIKQELTPQYTEVTKAKGPRGRREAQRC